jgi:DNA-binding response OmpR family regulator
VHLSGGEQLFEEGEPADGGYILVNGAIEMKSAGDRLGGSVVQPNLPVLMLTALGTTDDKLNGFDAGTDDYLVKPFEFKELVARVRALIKRSTGIVQAPNKLVTADLELDLNKKTAKRGNKTIELTAKEYALIEFLMRNTNIVVSRSQIAEQVWDIGFDTGTNTIDVYINILRKKIDHGFENKLIHTKIGMGYILIS